MTHKMTLTLEERDEQLLVGLCAEKYSKSYTFLVHPNEKLD